MSLDLFGVSLITDTPEKRSALAGAVVAAVALPFVWPARKVLAAFVGALLIGPVAGVTVYRLVVPKAERPTRFYRMPDGTIKELAEPPVPLPTQGLKPSERVL